MSNCERTYYYYYYYININIEISHDFSRSLLFMKLWASVASFANG
jgi:hypothetical protein